MTVDTASQAPAIRATASTSIRFPGATRPRPNSPENHPRVIFERLFGDGGNAQQRQARIQKTGSILDSVLEETSHLTNRLGRSDTAKLDEYLDSIRDVEQRIQNAEKQVGDSVELPDRPVGIPDTLKNTPS